MNVWLSPPAVAFAVGMWTVGTAAACHKYHTWNYPYPQRCGVAHEGLVRFDSGSTLVRSRAHYPATQTDRSWYVEITDADLRTPDQIRDFDEHYDAVAKHHDEINSLMVILHTEQDAARASGLKE